MLAYQNVLRLVSLLGKVQIMVDKMGLISHKFYLHIEFTPSLFLNAERWVFESYE